MNKVTRVFLQDENTKHIIGSDNKLGDTVIERQGERKQTDS